MDQPRYTKLIESLSHVPDPRNARGKRLEWTLLLGVIAAALLCQQRTARAMAQWAAAHATTLLAAFQPRRGRLPSEPTILRTLHKVDVTALEHHLAQFTATLATPPPAPLPAPDAVDASAVPRAGVSRPVAAPLLQGYAVDGKALRGAQAHGQPAHLVSLVQHGTGTVLAQTAVPDKRNEISAVPALLTGRTLRGTVIRWMPC